MSSDRTLLELHASNAADLMTPNPVSIFAGSTLENAAQSLSERSFSAMPVVDASARVVGVVSRTDIVRAVDRQSKPRLDIGVEDTDKASDVHMIRSRGSIHVEDIMTPKVFGVPPDASATEVIAQMAERGVHRLFVVDAEGVLVGVISAIDILRKVDTR